MASACFNVWRIHENSKGIKKWVNEGPAPDGACPSCPDMGCLPAGVWDGRTAGCSGGKIVKYVPDGNCADVPGDVIHALGTPQATQACNGDMYIGTGDISNYF